MYSYWFVWRHWPWSLPYFIHEIWIVQVNQFVIFLSYGFFQFLGSIKREKKLLPSQSQRHGIIHWQGWRMIELMHIITKLMVLDTEIEWKEWLEQLTFGKQIIPIEGKKFASKIRTSSHAETENDSACAKNQWWSSNEYQNFNVNLHQKHKSRKLGEFNWSRLRNCSQDQHQLWPQEPKHH